MRDVEFFDIGFITKFAMRLAPILYVRRGELRHAEWNEIDLEAAEWRISAAKMKGQIMHIGPLTSQVLAILEELQSQTGKSRCGRPNQQRADEREHHQCRASASGLRPHQAHGPRLARHGLHHAARVQLVLGRHRARQLWHAERNAVKAAYNHAEHLPARRKMMQVWADHLDA